MPTRRSTLITFLAIAFAGCSGGRDKNQNTITGLVTLDDQPLAGARVQFFPLDSGYDGPRALFGARTDSEGRYRTVGAPGTYKVTIVKWVRKDGFTLDPKIDDPGQLEMQTKLDPNSPYRSAVPGDYGNPDKTPFKRDVVSGPQTIDLPLSSPREPAKKP
jgi:hypothetical protein